MNDKEVEQEIQEKGLTAPRITAEQVDAAIIGEEYIVLPSGRTTIAELTLENGFVVIGESICVCIENFDAELGRKIARAQARDKIWAFMGYALRQKLHEVA
jgi:hypothetical protein